MNKYFENFSMLVENDLEQAKLVIAAQDVLDRLQKIAEHLAELGAEEIMPLSDNMKAAFGADIASNFEKTADTAIQKALESVRGARDVIDSAILRVQGNMNDVPNDISAPNDMADNTGIENDDTIGNDIDVDAIEQTDNESLLSNPDAFGGAESADNALGRVKKESVSHSFRKYGEKVLMNESIGSLVSWVVSDAKHNLTPKKFEKFREAVQTNIEKDPIATAGWIAVKKKTVANNAQTSNPTVAPSVKDEFVIESMTTNERKARAVAKVIEANIIAYGSGKASDVVNHFTSTDLNESASKNLIEDFKKIFGMSPAAYSVKLKKEITEDNGTVDPTPTTGTTDPSSNLDMTDSEKGKALAGIGDMASKIASNPGAGNQPVAAATASLPSDQQQAIDTVKDRISDTTGSEPETVNDLLKDAPEIVGEDKEFDNIVSKYSIDTLKKYVSKKENDGEGDSETVIKLKKYLEDKNEME